VARPARRRFTLRTSVAPPATTLLHPPRGTPRPDRRRGRADELVQAPPEVLLRRQPCAARPRSEPKARRPRHRRRRSCSAALGAGSGRRDRFAGPARPRRRRGGASRGLEVGATRSRRSSTTSSSAATTASCPS
jgi:hypothetical protein